MADHHDLVLALVHPGETVRHVGHRVVEAGGRRPALQQVVAVPEDRLALAAEEELAVFRRRDVADGVVDVEVGLLHVGEAALAHPVIGSHTEREQPRFQFAVGSGVGEDGRCAKLAVGDAPDEPRAVEGG